MLSQRDSRWKYHKIGNTDKIIGLWGCTITDLAYLADTTPDVMADRLYAVSALQGALVIWTRLAIAFPRLKFIWRGYNYNKIAVDRAVSQYGFCMVEVDFDSNNNTRDRHWVIQTEGGMLDPWTGKIKNYKIKTGYCIIQKTVNPIEEVFEMSDSAANVLKRAELGARLVTKDGKGYFLRINKRDYWIVSPQMMVDLGYGSNVNDIQYGKATKVKSLNPVY